MDGGSDSWDETCGHKLNKMSGLGRLKPPAGMFGDLQSEGFVKRD
jgi:hypothetical protein